MSKTVYVVGGDIQVMRMFSKRGWNVTGSQEVASAFQMSPFPLDLVCFTGGEDVSPSIYGETNQGSVGCNLSRDQEEVEVFNHYRPKVVGKSDHDEDIILPGVPFVGICRGGQLLNVLNGGSMIQDLGKTQSGVRCIHGFLEGGGSFVAGSVVVDHHQGMDADRKHVQHIFDDDVQCTVWYHETRSLCFQPHPEWGHKGTEGLFFDLLEEYIG